MASIAFQVLIGRSWIQILFKSARIHNMNAMDCSDDFIFLYTHHPLGKSLLPMPSVGRCKLEMLTVLRLKYCKINLSHVSFHVQITCAHANNLIKIGAKSFHRFWSGKSAGDFRGFLGKCFNHIPNTATQDYRTQYEIPWRKQIRHS